MSTIRSLEQRVKRLAESNCRYRKLVRDLAKEKKFLSSIIDNAPYGVCINRGKFGGIVYTNREFTNITGYTQEDIPTVPEWSYRAYPSARYRHALARVWKAMVDAGKGSALYRVVCKDGIARELETSLVVSEGRTVVNLFADVTRREKAEAALRESEEKFRLLFEESADAVLLLRGTRLIDCNRAAVTLLGWHERPLKAEGTLGRLFPRRQPGGMPALGGFREMVSMALERKAHRFEWTFRRNDGSTFPADVMITVIPFRGKHILYVVVRDISISKLAELALQRAKNDLETRVQDRTADLLETNQRMLEEIEVRKGMERELDGSRQQLRRLSEHLQSAQEEEKVRIAREVHDELGQWLLALKIDVARLDDRLSVYDQSLLDETACIGNRIDRAIGAVKTICTQLRPTVLDHFGLAAAIEWQLKDLGKRVPIQFTADLQPDVFSLDKELAVMLFRVFQEAITNTVRHSGASMVRVGIERKNGNLLLKIIDNGRGISKEEIGSPDSFGIMGIRERVIFWGGHTVIRGIPGKGTSVVISVPLDRSVSGSLDGEALGDREGA
jgi:PAS domain S-box-containing protein